MANKNNNPRALTIQDLSCLGQCSLYAAIAVLAGCGVECCPLPTAILSSHTGPEFARPYIKDLSEDIPSLWHSWQQQGITFDGIGIGYLASLKQIQMISQLLDGLRQDETLVLLDPVMGDNGRFYSGFDKEFAEGMLSLCAKCDVILPNLTEARFLLGDYNIPEQYDLAYCQQTAKALTALGPKQVVITGLDCLEGQISCLICNGENGQTQLVSQPRLPGRYHGTGDLFASVCLGLLLQGFSLTDAVTKAGQFVCESIKNTEPQHNYGVRFEGCLGLLADLIKETES